MEVLTCITRAHSQMDGKDAELSSVESDAETVVMESLEEEGQRDDWGSEDEEGREEEEEDDMGDRDLAAPLAYDETCMLPTLGDATPRQSVVTTTSYVRGVGGNFVPILPLASSICAQGITTESADVVHQGVPFLKRSVPIRSVQQAGASANHNILDDVRRSLDREEKVYGELNDMPRGLVVTIVAPPQSAAATAGAQHFPSVATVSLGHYPEVHYVSTRPEQSTEPTIRSPESQRPEPRGTKRQFAASPPRSTQAAQASGFATGAEDRAS
jgi:hypothetical protein